MAKAALKALTRSLAAELGPSRHSRQHDFSRHYRDGIHRRDSGAAAQTAGDADAAAPARDARGYRANRAIPLRRRPASSLPARTFRSAAARACNHGPDRSRSNPPSNRRPPRRRRSGSRRAARSSGCGTRTLRPALAGYRRHAVRAAPRATRRSIAAAWLSCARSPSSPSCRCSARAPGSTASTLRRKSASSMPTRRRCSIPTSWVYRLRRRRHHPRDPDAGHRARALGRATRTPVPTRSARPSIACWKTIARGFETLRSRTQAYIIVHSLELPARPSRGILDAQSFESQARGDPLDQRRPAPDRVGIQRRARVRLRRAGGVATAAARWRDEQRWATVKLPMRADAMLPLADEWVRYLAPIAGRICKVLVDRPRQHAVGRRHRRGRHQRHQDRSRVPRHRLLERPARAARPEAPRRPARDLQQEQSRGRARALSRASRNAAASRRFRRRRASTGATRPTSLREIAAELNVGLDSLAFLDDNPAERERVRARAAGGHRHRPARRSDGLRGSGPREVAVFERLPISAEDAERSRYYAEQRVRAGSARQRLERRGFLPLAAAGGRDRARDQLRLSRAPRSSRRRPTSSM